MIILLVGTTSLQAAKQVRRRLAVQKKHIIHNIRMIQTQKLHVYHTHELHGKTQIRKKISHTYITENTITGSMALPHRVNSNSSSALVNSKEQIANL